ncbi:MAG: YkgJ family cysteine cluster protein [Archaeoglobaceae archaeon]
MGETDLVKDVTRMEEISRGKQNENWIFNIILKHREPIELNSIVNNLYRELSSEIDCKNCANCCKSLRVRLDDEDIEEFCTGVKMNPEEFREQYLVKCETGEYIFKSLPCPFLKDNKCSNYEHRPKRCRSFPHLDRDDFITRLEQITQVYSICPIVFNLYERLKNDLDLQ